MHKKSKITIHFSNGEEYTFNGYRDYLIEALRDKEDYISCEFKMHVMKNNINYIKIEDIEESEED
jgi:hypothetical protein